jgi:small subunit ribosomal protein S6
LPRRGDRREEDVNRRYEVLFIVRPDIGDAGVKEQVDRAQHILEEQGATSVRIHDWGQRDLAYPIETHRRGRYVLIEYEGAVQAVAELERNFKLSDQILRYISVRQSNGAASVGDTERPTMEAAEHVPQPAAEAAEQGPQPAAESVEQEPEGGEA